MEKMDSAGRLSSREAALRIGLKVQTLAQMRVRGDGPEFFRIGNRIRYAPEAIDHWLESRRSTKSRKRKDIT